MTTRGSGACALALLLLGTGCNVLFEARGPPRPRDAGTALDAGLLDDASTLADAALPGDDASVSADGSLAGGDAGQDASFAPDASAAEDASAAAADASEPPDGTAPYDPPPWLSITSPNEGFDFSTTETSVTVSGECSRDATSLASTLGTFADADCSDGTWSLQPFPLQLGPFTFTVSAVDAAGTPASASLTVTAKALRVSKPSFDGSYHFTNAAPLAVSGTCRTDVTLVTTNLGSVADGDCSDGTWSLAPFSPPAEGSYDFAVSADGGGAYRTGTLHAVYDVTPPAAPTLTATVPPSGSDDNFPRVRGTIAEAGEVLLFKDPACTVRIGKGNFGELQSGDLQVVVVDDSTTSIHARERDHAGNLGPCSAGALVYQEVSGGLPACDVTVGASTTFAGLQAVLDAAEAGRAFHVALDGRVTVCLGDGVVVSTSGPAEGTTLRIPGDDFCVRGLGPTPAVLQNLRSDTPDVLSVVDQKNAALADLTLTASSGYGLVSERATLAFLRRVRVSARGYGLYLQFTDVAELSESTFSSELRAGWCDGAYLIGGAVGLIDRTTFASESAVELYSVQVSEVTASVFEGWSAGLRLRSGALLSRFVGNRIQKSQATDGAVALAFSHEAGAAPSVETANFTGNTVCTLAGATAWQSLLAMDGAAFSAPTVAYSPARPGVEGAQTVPWGDADDAAANPGHAWQAQWGGACP